MVDVHGDVLRPPHGTTPAAVKSIKNLRNGKTIFPRNSFELVLRSSKIKLFISSQANKEAGSKVKANQPPHTEQEWDLIDNVGAIFLTYRSVEMIVLWLGLITSKIKFDETSPFNKNQNCKDHPKT